MDVENDYPQETTTTITDEASGWCGCVISLMSDLAKQLLRISNGRTEQLRRFGYIILVMIAITSIIGWVVGETLYASLRKIPEVNQQQLDMLRSIIGAHKWILVLGVGAILCM